MNDERKKNEPGPGSGVTEVKEPHHLDIGSAADVAQWIAPYILGLITDVVYDMTKDAVRDMLGGIKRRFGKKRVRELETKVTELLGEVKEQSTLSDDEIADRMTDIFKDYR